MAKAKTRKPWDFSDVLDFRGFRQTSSQTRWADDGSNKSKQFQLNVRASFHVLDDVVDGRKNYAVDVECGATAGELDSPSHIFMAVTNRVVFAENEPFRLTEHRKHSICASATRIVWASVRNFMMTSCVAMGFPPLVVPLFEPSVMRSDD